MPRPQDNYKTKSSRGQAIIEYLAGILVVGLLCGSVFLLYMPDTLSDCYNQVFDSVEADLGF